MFFQSRIANKLKAERYAERDISKRETREKAIIRETYRSLNNKVYF